MINPGQTLWERLFDFDPLALNFENIFLGPSEIKMGWPDDILSSWFSASSVCFEWAGQLELISIFGVYQMASTVSPPPSPLLRSSWTPPGQPDPICRLCGQACSGPGALQVFSVEGKAKSLPEKVRLCLPVAVRNARTPCLFLSEALKRLCMQYVRRYFHRWSSYACTF